MTVEAIGGRERTSHSFARLTHRNPRFLFQDIKSIQSGTGTRKAGIIISLRGKLPTTGSSSKDFPTPSLFESKLSYSPICTGE